MCGRARAREEFRVFFFLLFSCARPLLVLHCLQPPPLFFRSPALTTAPHTSPHMIPPHAWTFVLNILILVPIALGTLTKSWPTDQGAFPESPGWRTLTGSLWTSILACSALGLVWPASFVWLPVFQVIYKSIWLCAYVLPRLREGGRRRRSEIPPGIAWSFAVIVIVWPCLIPWRQLTGGVN